VHPSFHDNLSLSSYIVIKEINQDPELFKSFYRTSIESFSILVELTGPAVQRKDINFHKAVTAEERLMITIR
jgi:hypothetical protein